MALTAPLTVVAAVVAASLTAVIACSAIRRGVERAREAGRAEERRAGAFLLRERERAPFLPAARRRAEVAAVRARRRAPAAFAETLRRALERPFGRDLLVRDAEDFLLVGITSISFLTYL